MGAAKTANEGVAQGAAPIESQEVPTPVTEKEAPAQLLEAQTPEWVETILTSNDALIASNEKVIEALASLKDFSSSNVGNYKTEMHASYSTEQVFAQEIDENEKYEVAEGKSFRDANDFSKEYKEGDDVSNLGAERLKSLLNQGLIVQS